MHKKTKLYLSLVVAVVHFGAFGSPTGGNRIPVSLSQIPNATTNLLEDRSGRCLEEIMKKPYSEGVLSVTDGGKLEFRASPTQIIFTHGIHRSKNGTGWSQTYFIDHAD